MIPTNVRPDTIDELERLMAEHARDHREANKLRQASGYCWQFPSDNANNRGRGGGRGN